MKLSCLFRSEVKKTGPGAAVLLHTVLISPEFKLFLEFRQKVLTPLQGPKAKSEKSGSVNLWRLVCIFYITAEFHIYLSMDKEEESI